MNIETYATTMIRLYRGLFMLAIFMGIVMIWRGIRKKSLNPWWVVLYLYTIFYSIFASCGIAIPYIAYDDPTEPGYTTFKNWRLYDFILNDIRMLIIWLFIGALLYIVVKRIESRKPIKKSFVILLAVLAVLFVAVMILSVTAIL